MDVSLFKRILDRRLSLQAELVEIDNFLRQAEALAARLFPPAPERDRYQERHTTISAPPDAQGLREDTNFSFAPLPGRLRTD